MTTSLYRIDTLEVFLEAEELSNKLWDIAYAKDFFVRDTVGKQLARSADSVSANIAEGYGHFWFSESKRFYYYSRASLLETKGWIRKLKDRNLHPAQGCDELLEECERLFAKLSNYIAFVQKQHKNLKREP